MGLKFVAWWITGSVALYSDALESIVNVIAALAAFWAIRVSHKPADHDHQHGHHKAEYFSAVLEGVLIVVAALLILVEVWRAWRIPGRSSSRGWAWRSTAPPRPSTRLGALLIRAGRAGRRRSSPTAATS